MKKLLTALLAAVFLVSTGVSFTPNALGSPNDGKDMFKYGNPVIQPGEANAAPAMVSGKLSGQLSKDMAGVVKFLDDNKAVFKVADANKEFKELETKGDNLGFTHVKVQQLVDGIPVFGNEYIVHFDKDGVVYAANGNFNPQAGSAKVDKNLISQLEAIDLAKADVTYTQLDRDITSKLYLYRIGDTYTPVYEVRISFSDPEPGDWHVFVNAQDGSIVNKYNGIKYGSAATGTGVGVIGDSKPLNLYYSSPYYYLIDISKPMFDPYYGIGYIRTYDAKNRTALPGYSMYDTDTVFNSTTQAAGVDAHYYAGVVYDYYYDNFGRDSIDGYGMNILSTVHYKLNYNNAFWNGYQMVYGDGDGVTFIPLSAALDVVAHEMTHGVTDYDVGLVYQDQSGALSESYSDIFGSLVEGNNWELGEVIYTPGIPGDALRSLSNPPLYGDPDNMSEYVYTSEDYGGVHTNCGIPNKAGYLVAQSIGNYKTGQIYYRSLLYLTSTSQFSNARAALLQSAADLYGYGGVEYNAVASAFDAVGI